MSIYIKHVDNFLISLVTLSLLYQWITRFKFVILRGFKMAQANHDHAGE